MKTERFILLAVFITALSLQLATLPPWDTLTYDGALYIDIARNLVENPSNFTYQGIYVMYRPPLYPYTLSLLYHFIKNPLDQLTVARLVSVLFFSMTAVLVYLFAKGLFEDETKSLLTSFYFTFNPLAFTMGGRELVHSEFTFFYTLALYLFYTGRERNSVERLSLAFVSAGMAILTRYTGLSIIGVFFAYLWLVDYWNWVKKREYWVGALLLFLTLSPWLYLGHLHYGGALRPFSIGMRTVTADKPVAVSDYLRMVFKDIGRVLPVLAFLGFIKQEQDEKGWLLVSWLAVGLSGILMVTHKETRFITFLSPVLALLSVEGTELVVKTVEEITAGRTKHLRAFILVAVSVLLLVPVAMGAFHLKEEWNTTGKYESHVLRYASEHYPAERLLVSPPIYTMAGFYYPRAKVEMPLPGKGVEEKLAGGYYQVIIYREPSGYAPTPPRDKYTLVGEFYSGRFKIYIKKSN
jgi:4-amino-4-deoxy-L-arabinose transferase-like glycosyltransferase